MPRTQDQGVLGTANGSASNLVPRSDWGANHYGNEIDGAFLNYNFISSSQGWQVTDKSGTTYYYGSNPGLFNSQQTNQYGTYKWLLDKVQDVNGNYMTVTYQTGPTDNQLYLYEIDYTGNVNSPPLSPTNSVFFDLEQTARSDVLVSEAGYSAVTTAYRLQAIRVYGNAQAARKYQLNYTYSPSSSRSLLQSVTQYGRDGTNWTDSLPPVTFAWGQRKDEGSGLEIGKIFK